jgi:transmembrane protein 231
MPQIFASPLMRRYYGPLFSSAFLYRQVSIIATIVVPFIVSYTIKPFWLTESTYTEQPAVRFKHQMIIMLEGKTAGSDLVWSTYDQLNTMVGSKYRVAEVQARQDDANRDGKPDKMYIQARFPLKAGEVVHHVRMIAFFDYALSGKVNLRMESAAYFDHSSMVSGGECQVHGTLRLRQRDLLPQSATQRTVYNTPVIKQSNGGIDSMQQALFTTIIPDYLSRNETTDYADTYPIWIAGAGSEFVLKANIAIPVNQEVQYRPGVFETIRYAILQYLALYIFVAALVGAATHFLFENQVFETRVHDDSKPKTHIH